MIQRLLNKNLKELFSADDNFQLTTLVPHKHKSVYGAFEEAKMIPQCTEVRFASFLSVDLLLP